MSGRWVNDLTTKRTYYESVYYENEGFFPSSMDAVTHDEYQNKRSGDRLYQNT